MVFRDLSSKLYSTKENVRAASRPSLDADDAGFSSEAIATCSNVMHSSEKYAKGVHGGKYRSSEDAGGIQE